ncbi:sulfurtransferase [Nostocoides sp. F2B08]|uniref:sulfurtransferase n=1 Tax=Nostocoides sp. F2B08 TaxID=2653936 RepID=UPI001262D151|nr:sulfurtransferase [Tetrasphaera sp. F2B08]KAB7744723.1 sulfurtransferase [Tetrasphaera sp. F2B08]
MSEPASPLISAEALAKRLDRVRVLDVQYALTGTPGEELYAVAHLPGAPHLDLDRVLADPPGSRGRHPLPAVERLQDGLRAAGLHDDSSVVVYDQRTSLGAARAWWVLRWAGLQDVRVLDGGLAAWVRDGGATTDALPEVAQGTVTVRPGALPVLAADDVSAFVDSGGLVLDARTPERFRGESEPIDREGGHIPGSVNLPIAELLGPDGTFASPEAIRAAAGAHRIPLGRGGAAPTLGTSCGSGITACQLTLALRTAGIESVPYIGSWSEWIADPTRPRALGDA